MARRLAGPTLRRRSPSSAAVAGLLSTGLVAAVVAFAAPAGAAAASAAVGHWDSVTTSQDRTITVAGWVLPGYYPLFTIDGHTYGYLTEVPRPDPRDPAASPTSTATATSTPFAWTSPALAWGAHKFCVNAVGPGASAPTTALGCKTVTLVDANNPVGSTTFTKGTSGVTWKGRVFDPNDQSVPLQVQYLLDGKVRETVTAPAYPAYFTRTWTLAGTAALRSGTHTIQIRAINIGAGSANPIIGSFTFMYLPDWSGGSQALYNAVMAIHKKLGNPRDPMMASFNYVWPFPYLGISGKADPGGDFVYKYALSFYQNRGGNCYQYASMFAVLARSYGYDVKVVVGKVPEMSGGFGPHGWTEFRKGNTTYVIDPELKHEYPGYNWYMNTYGHAPITYIKVRNVG
ncbi:MAG: transglutaminase-like domain-containing protein [Actinomycetia bacterium]|nr:transglutaminase-like domain-containing protein [Actinomycetes bacterium]